MSEISDDDLKRFASPFYSSLLPKHEHPELDTLEDGELFPTFIVARYGGDGTRVIPGLLGRQDPSSSIKWCVGQDTPTVPLAFDHWITFREPLLKVPEYNHLARIVGEKHVDYEDRADFEHAIKELISEIAFPELKSHWNKLADHLDKIIRTGTAYLKTARPFLKLDDKVVIVPAPITVLVSLLSCPDTAIDMRAGLAGVERTVKHCQNLRMLMASKIQRGPKGQPALAKVFSVVVKIAGDNLALPSNAEMAILDDDEAENSKSTTPILRLARDALGIASHVGIEALDRAALTDDRRTAAKKRLRKLGEKSDRALADHLRPIIKSPYNKRRPID